MAFIVPVTELKKHNVASITDWIEAKGTIEKGTSSFAAHYKDHQVKIKISGRNLAVFADCEITSFKFDLEHTTLKCHILAKGCEGDPIGKLFDVIDAHVEVVTARGKHWKEQQEMELAEESESSEEQSEIPDETKEKIERNKERANKRNTDKARGRK